MADQAAIVQELYNRIDTLPPEKQAIVSELAKRFGTQRVPDATAQAQAGDRSRALDSMQLDNPYNFVDNSGGSFLGSAKEAFTGMWHGLTHLPTFDESSPTGTADSMKDLPAATVGRVADQAQAGNYGGAAGTLAGTGAGIAATMLAGEALNLGVRGVKAAVPKVAAKIVLPRSGTPEQRAGVDWALQNGAPLDAAAASLNPLVRGTQEIARTTIGAGTQAEHAIEARNQWYADKLADLSNQAHPTPQTPETAGAAINKQGIQTIQNANTEATDAYSALRERENDPKTWAEVQTGTKQETRQMMTGTSKVPVPGVVGLDGSPAFREEPVIQHVTREVPVTEHLPMPVDMREYKAQFSPALDAIQRQTRLGQQQYAPAQIALEDLVNGPDYVPASVAEKNLGALKRVSDNGTLTGGVKDEAGGLAASMIPKLQSAIDDAVKQYGGSDALKDLQNGRAQTAAKYNAIDLVDQLKTEPVKTTNLLSAPKDANIELLREVNKLAPEQTPMLGRAWLDSRLGKATESGGFSHADKLFSDWQNLGDQTKQIYFKNPALISDLNKFFQSAKDSAKVENTSGTAKVNHISGQVAAWTTAAGMTFINPLALAGPAIYTIGGNVVARLLYNPRFVRAAIRGFNTASGSAGAAAAAANLIAAAGSAATPQNAGGPIAAPAPGVATSGGVSTNAGRTASTNAGGASAPIQGVLASAEAGSTVRGATAGGTRSADTNVVIPGESGPGYAAAYKLRELNDVQPSHSGQTFLANPKYGIKNDRDYSNALNQGKVINWSSRAMFNPKQVLSDIDDATGGPPVVDAQGNVLGGNGRTMIMQRVYDSNPKGAAAYRDLLAQKAEQFGIDPAGIKGMKQPVLVREVPDSEFNAARTKQHAITDFNKKGTASLTAEEQAIADSRRVSQSTLEDIAGRLDAKGADATLAQALEGKSGVEVLEQLVKDGVISPQEQAGLTKEDALTPAGKDRISKLMTARFFEDPNQLDTLAPSLRNKVERIAAPLAQVEGRPEWNISSDVENAVKILHEAQTLKIKNVEDFIKQDGLFGKEKYSDKAQTIAKSIQTMKPSDLAAAFRQYAQDANYAAKGANTLMGDAPTPESAFADAFPEVKPAKNALAPKK